MACHGLQQTPSDTILKSTRRVMGGSDILRNSWSPDHQMVSVTPSHKGVVTTFFQFPDISIIDLKREHLQRNFSTFVKWVFSFIVSFWERRTLLWIRWIMKYIQWWCKEETKANFPLFVGTPGQHDILTKFEFGQKACSLLPSPLQTFDSSSRYWLLDTGLWLSQNIWTHHTSYWPLQEQSASCKSGMSCNLNTGDGVMLSPCQHWPISSQKDQLLTNQRLEKEFLHLLSGFDRRNE